MGLSMRRTMLIAAGAALALALGTSVPAAALGNYEIPCSSGPGTVKGYSWSGGAQTYPAGG